MNRFLSYSWQRLLFLPPMMLLLILLISSPVFSKPLNATIHFVPASGFLHVGDEIEVDVWVSDVANLYGLDIQLAFDPTLFEIIDADPALPGVQIVPRNDLLSPDIVIKKTADNTKGTLWYAVTQLNPSPAVSGSGAVFAFKLRPLRQGMGAFNFDSFKLATRDGEIIPATAVPVTYQIDATSPQLIFLPFLAR